VCVAASARYQCIFTGLVMSGPPNMETGTLSIKAFPFLPLLHLPQLHLLQLQFLHLLHLQVYKPMNTFVALVGLEVWSSGDQISVTPPAGATLDAFNQWRNSALAKKKKHDNAQLIRSLHTNTHTVFTHTRTVSTHRHTNCIYTHTKYIYTHTQSIYMHTHTVSTHTLSTHAQYLHTHCIHTQTYKLSTHTQSIYTHTHKVSTRIHTHYPTCTVLHTHIKYRHAYTHSIYTRALTTIDFCKSTSLAVKSKSSRLVV